MADKKITELTALTSVANSDVLVIVDDPAGTAVSKKVTADVLGEYMSTNTHVVNAINAATPTIDFSDQNNILANAVFA
jgi:hypothetical protein